MAISVIDDVDKSPQTLQNLQLLVPHNDPLHHESTVSLPIDLSLEEADDESELAQQDTSSNGHVCPVKVPQSQRESSATTLQPQAGELALFSRFRLT